MNPQKTITTRAWIEICFLSLIWGGSFLAFSLALRELGVFTTVAFRIAGGALVLGIYVRLRKMALPKNPRIWGAFMVMGLLNNVIPFSLIAWGQLRIPSGLASILNASTALFGVLVASVIFSDERLTTPKAVGVSLGFLGVSIAIGLSAMRDLNLTSLSQLAIIGAALSYALAGAWARGTMQGLSPQVSAAGMTICASVIMIPLALQVDGVPDFDYATTTWGAIIYSSVFATALAYLLYYRVLEMAGSGNLMLVTLTITPVAIILGARVLDEALPRQAYIGFALLAAGLLVIDGRIVHHWRRR